MLKETIMLNEKYDALDGWREENGIKNSKGEIKKYAGGCEYDPTYEAIIAYEKEQQKKDLKKLESLEMG